MTTVSLTSKTPVLALLRGTGAAASSPSSPADDLIKTATGISNKPSYATRQAASAAAGLAMAAALSDGKVIYATKMITIADLGSFDTFDEAVDYVDKSPEIAKDKKFDWVKFLRSLEKSRNEIEEFMHSGLGKKLKSGELQPPKAETRAYSVDEAFAQLDAATR